MISNVFFYAKRHLILIYDDLPEQRIFNSSFVLIWILFLLSKMSIIQFQEGDVPAIKILNMDYEMGYTQEQIQGK